MECPARLLCWPPGMRVGYGAFPLDMIQYLWRAKQPYNVSVAAEVGNTSFGVLG